MDLQTVLDSVLLLSGHRNDGCSDRVSFETSVIGTAVVVAENSSIPRPGSHRPVCPGSLVGDEFLIPRSKRLELLKVLQNEVSRGLLQNPQHLSQWQDHLFFADPQMTATAVYALASALETDGGSACAMTTLLAMRLVLSGPCIVKRLTRPQLFSLAQVLAAVNTNKAHLRKLLGQHMALLEKPVQASSTVGFTHSIQPATWRAPIYLLCDAVVDHFLEAPPSAPRLGASLLSFVIKQALEARRRCHHDGALVVTNNILRLAYLQLGLDPGVE